MLARTPCSFGPIGHARIPVATTLSRIARRQKTTRVPALGIRASGHMAGSKLGFFHLQTLVSGSCPCLLAKVLLIRPHLRSHSGHNSGCALSHAPTTPQFTIQPHLFQLLLRKQLRLSLFLTESTCSSCHEPLDPLEYHRAACSHSRRTQRRATPMERVMARICREAGARVKFNAPLERHER